MQHFPPLLSAILQCPVCSQPLQDVRCLNCQTEFFSFGGIASFMPAGKWQLPLWQHQLALNNQQAQLGLEAMQAMLERPDLVPATQRRIEESLKIAQMSNQSLNDLLHEVGVFAQYDEQFAPLNLGALSEYYHHILQDWAWGNQAITQRLTPILEVFNPAEVGTLLALGAGAGRLSWELHNTWRAQITLATDINPLLLTAGHKLIKQQASFNFYELNSFPQIQKPLSASYTITPPADLDGRRQGWFAMAADAWAMPIKPNSVDVIFTAWFIDVHGGDNRDLISQILRWLKPGGVWINSGPLLYPKASPLELKYGRDELLELIHLAGLDMVNQQLSEYSHLNSPINVRQQTEQVWTFCVRKPTTQKSRQQSRPQSFSSALMPPAWLVFHDTPVPPITKRLDQSHPLIDQILAQVDGNNSINSICALTAEHFPEGLDTKATVVEILAELFNLEPSVERQQ